MIIDKKSDSIKFMYNLFLLNLFILLQITSFHQIGAIPCVSSKGARGECTLLRNCRSAISQITERRSVEYCNYELNEVCCLDSNNDRYVKQKDVFSNERDFQISRESQNDDLDKTKHGIGKIDNNGSSLKKNNQNVEEPENLDRNFNNLYSEKNKHRQRPHNAHKHFSPILGDDNYFLPPGIAKKKAWNNEKTTPDNYYYEFATKKPNRDQNQNNFNRPNFFEENNPHKWEYERTTKRNTESSNWHFPQTDFPNSFSHEKTTKRNQWSEKYTTRRNQWGQETTTRRNQWGQETTTRKNQWGQQTTTRRNFPPDDNHFSNNYEENERPNERPNQSINKHQSFLEPNNPNYKPPSQERKRKSEIMCIEYSKEITKNVTGLPLTTNPNPVTIPVRKCIQAQQLIVGGENTTIGEFPHMAAVGFRDRNNQGIAWNCGGTLISDKFVLTAAHCTSTNLGRPIKVRLGAHNLKKNYNEVQFFDYSVVDIITHPEYKPPSKYNDIALLKLSNRVTFFEHIRPACLNVEDTLSAPRAIATGWGKMAYDGNVSETLLKVVLNIVDNNTCNRLYKVNGKTAVLSRGIVDSQLCAGEFSGGKDTCQGDSGGPLSITNTKCIHHVIGVTSFGKGCAQANTAGVYTRVSAYIPWIESVVWP